MIVADTYSPKTIFGQFIEDYHVSIIVVTCSLIFLRIPIGMWLESRENNLQKEDGLHHKAKGTLYIFGWWKVKHKENKTHAFILNLMLVLAFLIFFGILFGSIFSGELN